MVTFYFHTCSVQAMGRWRRCPEHVSFAETPTMTSPLTAPHDLTSPQNDTASPVDSYPEIFRFLFNKSYLICVTHQKY